MAKARKRFVCESCGATQPRWEGKCPECGEWNTMVESVAKSTNRASRGAAFGHSRGPSRATRLSEIPTNTSNRYPVPIRELNRVLGGGIVPGSVILIGGDPGIGKSTLLLQMAAAVGQDSAPSLYVSGEESQQQIKLRARRLQIATPNLLILAETDLDQIIAEIQNGEPRVVVVDSIQSVFSDQVDSSPGSITQVRECASALLRVAKSQGVPVFLVGHVTKAGNIAGPKVLEHMVDTVLYMEGERFHSYRLLRSVKNRYGSTNEVGVFEMREEGMLEVPNPSQVFLEERIRRATGSSVAVTMEGTRPILVEIQALVSRGNPQHPRRTANGISFNRLLLMTAVLSKRVGLRLSDQDIFVNVVGGLRVDEPAVDLAVAVAIASSFYNRPVRPDMAIFGEIGLAGELRSVGRAERRLSEARKLGFQQVLMPKMRSDGINLPDLKLVHARTLAESVQVALIDEEET